MFQEHFDKINELKSKLDAALEKQDELMSERMMILLEREIHLQIMQNLVRQRKNLEYLNLLLEMERKDQSQKLLLFTSAN